MTKKSTEFSDIDTNTLTGALPVHEITTLRRPSVVGASVRPCVSVWVVWVPVRVPLSVPVNYNIAREREQLSACFRQVRRRTRSLAERGVTCRVPPRARPLAAMRDRMPTPFSRTSLSMSFKKKNAMAQSSKDESSPLFADVPSVGGDKTSSRPSATGASHSEAQKLVRATSSLDEALAPEQAPLGSGVDSRP